MRTIVIIGAGPAGLTAAYEFSRHSNGDKIILLEETPEIGGISRTVVHGHCRIDIGGHRFFSRSKVVNDIWNELMPIQGSPSKDDLIVNRRCHVEDGGPDPERAELVMLRRHRISRIYYLRHFFDYPISIKWATFCAMGVIRTVKAGFSYLKSVFFKRREKSLEDFYINRFGAVLYSMFFEDYTEKLWGVHPSRISPEWGAQRVKGLSLWKAMLNVFTSDKGRKETSLIEEFLYPKRGPGQLWECMANRFVANGGDLRLNSRVVRLEVMAGRVSSVVLADGSIIKCDAVFSSMPIKDLVAAFDDVPMDVSRVASDLPYRDFITVGLLLDEMAVKNATDFPTVNNIVPDTWIYVQEREVKLGRIQIFNNWSPYMVDDVTKHVWIGLEYFCSEGDKLWEMNDSDFIEMATNELKMIGVLSEQTKVLDSVRIKVKKAYPAYFGSYAEFGEVRKWLDAFPNLYCIGRNGQHRYNNMDHSMLCGIEAVNSFLNGNGKTKVWAVNTEDAYHEGK